MTEREELEGQIIETKHTIASMHQTGNNLASSYEKLLERLEARLNEL